MSQSRPNQAIGGFGSTPTIVVATPFKVMLRPMTCGSELRCLRQKFWLTSATSAFISSSGRKFRPRIGLDAERLEIIRGRVRAVELHRIAEAGEDVTHPGVGGEAGEDGLAVAKMPVARDRHRELLEVSLLRFGLENDESVRFLERQAAQKQIVDQTEDGGVHPDAERERDHGEKGERGRLEELAKSEAEIDHGNSKLRLLDFGY